MVFPFGGWIIIVIVRKQCAHGSRGNPPPKALDNAEIVPDRRENTSEGGANFNRGEAAHYLHFPFFTLLQGGYIYEHIEIRAN